MTKEREEREARGLDPHFGDTVGELKAIIANDPELRWEYEALSLKLGLAMEFDRLRSDLGMSQSELAAASGTTQPMVSRFLSEEDERSPTLETLVKFADALGKRLKITLVDRMAPATTWSTVAVTERPHGVWGRLPTLKATTLAATAGSSWEYPELLAGAANLEALVH